MSRWWNVKPEQTLRKAEELVRLGNKNDALNTLYAAFVQRRQRQWQEAHEPLMLLYLSLAVDLQKLTMIKEGIHQYKFMCQASNVASLSTVVKALMNFAEARVEEARKKAMEYGVDVVDGDQSSDMEGAGNLFEVIGDETKIAAMAAAGDYAKRAKFAWETHRLMLELHRFGAKVETVYYDVTVTALEFCVKYKRTGELRRLSEMLRKDMQLLVKYQNQPQNVNLSNPPSLLLFVNARFAQLRATKALQLWQEAYRTIEDLHSLFVLGKTPPTSSVLSDYLTELVGLFWTMESPLLHAYALYKLFVLIEATKAVDEEGMAKFASRVVVAALSIPPEEDAEDPANLISMMGAGRESKIHVAQVLGFSGSIPTRRGLMSKVVSRGLPELCPAAIQNGLSTLEHESHPLDLVAAMKPTLDAVEADTELKQYVPWLHRFILFRTVQQISRTFSTFRIADLIELMPLLSEVDTEKYIIVCVANKQLFARFDYQHGVLRFDTNESRAAEIRRQLTVVSTRLATVVDMIHPERQAERREKKMQAFTEILESQRAEHQRILARKVVIERRKEEHERMLVATEQEDHYLERTQREIKRQQEAERLARDAKERERKRVEKEMHERRKIESRMMLAEVERLKMAMSQRRQKELKDLAERGAPEAIRKTLVDTAKEVKLAQARQQAAQARRLDHLERALREEEAPLMRRWFSEKKESDTEIYEEQIRQMTEQYRKAHDRRLAEKHRIARMRADYEKFLKALRERRGKIAREKTDEARARRIVELREKRELDARERERLQQEAETRQRLEDRERFGMDEDTEAPTWRPGDGRRAAAPDDSLRGAWRGGAGARADDGPPREDRPWRPGGRGPPDEQRRPWQSGEGAESGAWRDGEREQQPAQPAWRPGGQREERPRPEEQPWRPGGREPEEREERPWRPGGGRAPDEGRESFRGGWRAGRPDGEREKPEEREERPRPEEPEHPAWRPGGQREERPRPEEPEHPAWRPGGQREERPRPEEPAQPAWRPGGQREERPRPEEQPWRPGGREPEEREERPWRPGGGRAPDEGRESFRGGWRAGRPDGEREREEAPRGRWSRDAPPADGPPPPREEPAWRPGGPQQDDRSGPVQRGGWRAGRAAAPAESSDARRQDEPAGDDDGWTTVPHGRRH